MVGNELKAHPCDRNLQYGDQRVAFRMRAFPLDVLRVLSQTCDYDVVPVLVGIGVGAVVESAPADTAVVRLRVGGVVEVAYPASLRSH